MEVNPTSRFKGIINLKVFSPLIDFTGCRCVRILSHSGVTSAQGLCLDFKFLPPSRRHEYGHNERLHLCNIFCIPLRMVQHALLLSENYRSHCLYEKLELIYTQQVP